MDFKRVRVTKIEEIFPEEPEYVYDIIMDDATYPFFFANNILVHNSNYFLTGADSVDEAIQIGKYVQKIMNASFPEFIKNNFFISEKYTSFISVDFETMAQRGIWVAPKNYILDLAFKDGKKVDEMKVMGVKIKKTNIPKSIRKALISFIKTYIKTKDWKSLGLEIVEYRDKIKNSTTQDIGLPIQIKGFEQYTANYIANNKEKTKMPGHVAASVCWNEMLDTHNDKETQKISSGMKIKTFYLRKNIRHFKSIAIPTDLKILPKWFIEEVEPLIDNELQVIRLVDNALKQILDAVNERLPTKQSLLVDEEFY